MFMILNFWTPWKKCMRYVEFFMSKILIHLEVNSVDAKWSLLLLCFLLLNLMLTRIWWTGITSTLPGRTIIFLRFSFIRRIMSWANNSLKIFICCRRNSCVNPQENTWHEWCEQSIAKLHGMVDNSFKCCFLTSKEWYECKITGNQL